MGGKGDFIRNFDGNASENDEFGNGNDHCCTGMGRTGNQKPFTAQLCLAGLLHGHTCAVYMLCHCVICTYMGLQLFVFAFHGSYRLIRICQFTSVKSSWFDHAY